MTKVKLDGERIRYTVMARDERFVIMVKPFNAKRTYLYTIVDLERSVRGRCNKIFGLDHDVSDPAGAATVLADLQNGSTEVIYRHCVPLTQADIAAIGASV